MDKANPEQQAKSKLMIAKDRFCDGDFDKLVRDTSNSIAQRGLDSVAVLDLKVVVTGSGQSGDEIDYDRVPPNARSNSPQQSINSQCGDFNRLNQPKRPMNAFMVWGQAIRRELHHKFSNVQNALLSKALGRVWRSLDAAEKEPFVKKANLIKAEHKRDYPNYRYQPRRVQERRARSNMLIGINLNHPVNQQSHKNQQSVTYLSEQFIATHGTTNHHHQQQLQVATHSSLDNHPHVNNMEQLQDTSKTKLCSGTSSHQHHHHLHHHHHRKDSRARNLTKEHNSVDGVQAFEYHPYSATASSSSLDTTMNASECSCRPTSNGGCQSDMSHGTGSQHQSYTVYPPYQQLAYSIMPQYHSSNQQQQQQQQLPLPPHQTFTYDATLQQQQQQQQSNQFDFCCGGGPPSILNKGDSYYGTR